MSLSPLLSASPAVQIHVASALLAMAIGPVALLRRSRDGIHRWAGKIFVLSIGLAIFSSFFIWSIRIWGPFSPIHLLSVSSGISLWLAVLRIRQRRVAEHANLMRALYWQALGIAGLLALFPGRVMHRVIFGQDTWLGALIAVGAGFAALAWFVGRPALLSRFSSSLRKTDPL